MGLNLARSTLRDGRSQAKCSRLEQFARESVEHLLEQSGEAEPGLSGGRCNAELAWLSANVEDSPVTVRGKNRRRASCDIERRPMHRRFRADGWRQQVVKCLVAVLRKPTGSG